MKNNDVLNEFWRRLKSSDQAVLLLDYDGTLAPFRVARDQATPYPGVRERLAIIRQETRTRLVIISGRAIDDLLPLLGLDPPPEIWGCHGWEKLAEDGRRPALELPRSAREGLAAARQWVEDEGMSDFCELKPASLAIHWRGLPEAERSRLQQRVESGWQSIARESGLEIHPFNGGLELRCPGRDKGTAIRSILDQLTPEQPVAFLGDDLTDEDGFAAVEDHGLSVLVSNETRKTGADLRITPPDELLAFLDLWHKNASDRTASQQGG